MDGLDGRKRLSIEERAARRDRLIAVKEDRYASLLHALRAGRQVDLRRPPAPRLEWHPIAATLLRIALVAVCLYVVALAAVRWYRLQGVDTWSGPTASVASGQRLAGCDAANDAYDDAFPQWIRFGGHVFTSTGLSRPVGYGVNPSYPETGYTLGDLNLMLVLGTPGGKAGEELLIRSGPVPVGQLYVLAADCH